MRSTPRAGMATGRPRSPDRRPRDRDRSPARPDRPRDPRPPGDAVLRAARGARGSLWQRRAGRGRACALAIAALCVIARGRSATTASTDAGSRSRPEGGVTFWTGNHPLARRRRRPGGEPRPQARRAGVSRRASRPDAGTARTALLSRGARLDPARIRAPGSRSMARKVFYPVVPVGPSYALHSARYRVASVVSYLLVLPAAVVGRVAAAAAATRPVPSRSGCWPPSTVAGGPGVLPAGTIPDSRRSIRRSSSARRAGRPACDRQHERARRPADLQRTREPAERSRPASCSTTASALLVVDDGSPDGTGAVADRARARIIRAASKSCTAPGRAGSAAPTSTGCCTRSRRHADFDLPDGRRPVARSGVPAATRRRAAATHDLVIGSRYLNGASAS